MVGQIDWMKERNKDKQRLIKVDGQIDWTKERNKDGQRLRWMGK